MKLFHDDETVHLPRLKEISIQRLSELNLSHSSEKKNKTEWARAWSN